MVVCCSSIVFSISAAPILNILCSWWDESGDWLLVVVWRSGHLQSRIINAKGAIETFSIVLLITKLMPKSLSSTQTFTLTSTALDSMG